MVRHEWVNFVDEDEKTGRPADAVDGFEALYRVDLVTTCNFLNCSL